MVAPSIKTFDIEAFIASIAAGETGKSRNLTPEAMDAAMATLPPWVVCGIPDLVVVDNGMDLRSKNVVAAFQALGIDLVYAPPRTPWYKGVIERFGRTLNTRFVHWLPGTTLGKQTSDVGYNGRDHAVLTFDAFKLCLEAYLRLIHNRKPRHGRPGTCLQRFLRGISQWPVRMPVSMDEFDAAVALSAEVALQQTGVWYLGLQYQNDALKALWNRVPGGTRLTIKVNPLDLRRIKVLRPVTQEVITVQCVSPVEWPRSHAYHIAVRAQATKDGKDPNDLEDLALADAAMKRILAEALKSSKRALRRMQAELHRQSQQTEATAASQQKGVAATAREKDLVAELNRAFGAGSNDEWS